MDILLERFQVALKSFQRNVEADLLKKESAEITGPQMSMLQFIEQSGTCRLSLLAEKMDVKPSAVTVMIDRLEKANFVKRTHDTVDRRSVLVEMTELGKEVLKKTIFIRNEIMNSYLSRVETNELRVVIELLEKMMGIKQSDR